MEMLKRLDPLWLLLMVLGGLNWAIVAIFDTNVFSEVFGAGTVRDVAYCVVGFAALMYVPRALAALHIGTDRLHPHGA
jgi:uncharacterized membrane protein YuzA (DUF378 family)